MIRLILLALLVTCSVAKAAETDEQIKCSHEGRKFAKEWKTEWGPKDVTENIIVGNAEFHFSGLLKTCLAYTEVTEGESDKELSAIWHQKRITDIFSNRVIVYTRFMIDKKSKKEFYMPLKVVGDAKLVNNSDFADIKTMYFSE